MHCSLSGIMCLFPGCSGLEPATFLLLHWLLDFSLNWTQHKERHSAITIAAWRSLLSSKNSWKSVLDVSSSEVWHCYCSYTSGHQRAIPSFCTDCRQKLVRLGKNIWNVILTWIKKFFEKAVWLTLYESWTDPIRPEEKQKASQCWTQAHGWKTHK